MEKLIQLLNAVTLMSPELEAYLRTIIRPRLYKKGEFILQAGSVCTHIGFIETGLIRIYHEVGNKEVVSWLLKEGHIFIAVDSFFSQIISSYYIQALEDTLVWGISFDQLVATCLKYIEFNDHKDKIKTKYYELSEEIKKMITLPPKERYQALVKADADLVYRTSLSDLASYLQMSMGSLKQIRRDTSNGK